MSCVNRKKALRRINYFWQAEAVYLRGNIGASREMAEMAFQWRNTSGKLL